MIKKIFSKLFVFKRTAAKSTVLVKPEKKLSEVERLLKDATECKKKDIHKSIELLKQAIEISPSQEYYFKLANYVYQSGSIDGAYKIYDDLMAELDESDVVSFNLKKSAVYEKLCTLNYKTDRYQDYMACYFYWLYNYVVGLAFSGKGKELNKILKAKNKLALMAPGKVEGCFKKLNKEDLKPVYADKVSEYFRSFTEELIAVSKLNDRKIKKKTQDPKDNMEDIVYTDLFKKYNDDSVMNFYQGLNSLFED